ncbi:MAG TPA: hypothetical protein ENI34_08550 [candidate division WOR-3 bacterium]|uniref:SIR2-like domain-containing protein n=1 Tax=candidate division WOR-3 bacterium TaxID=2052148 RepID=A0A9C9ENP0_UNCW3|nr:hypothetical protein [candidate division WOR-3 bacterium]
MADNKTDIILFVGAGFSKPAGVPLMNEFVSLFENRLREKGDSYHKYFLLIKKYMTTAGTADIDLEILMDILYRLASGNTVEMSAWQEKEGFSEFNEEIRKTTKLELENLIREKCIIDPKTKLDAYYPLNDIFNAVKPLDIFSVNYDDVLEVFCYKNKYRLEDGFALYWDPTRFDNLDGVDVRLLKLHGSVLWYRTVEGAFYKVLQRVPQEYNTLITGEELEQLIAYPVTGKPIHVAPLAYAMNELRNRLEEVSQCIIIGYSMRDQHIQDIFIEVLKRNDKLKLILVNPDPFTILKNNIKHEALKRSIIPAAFRTEEIFQNNKILTISSFVRKTTERPYFEAMKNPLKSAQEYFGALNYRYALELVKEPLFWQIYSGYNLRNVDFLNILAGLIYSHMVGRFSSDKTLEKEAFDLIEQLLQKTASSIKERYDFQIFFERSIRANEWVQNYLQGKFKNKVEEITKMRISILKMGLTEMGKTKDINELKKIAESRMTILLKFNNGPIIPYDDGDFHWLFNNGEITGG